MPDGLFVPLTIGAVTLRNRIAVSPMCMYSAEDGFANNWHLVHLGSRAVGGAGLVITEATAVAPEGRISPADLGIWKNEHIEGLQKIAEFVSQHGAIPAIQLAHAGRKASCNAPHLGGNQLGLSDGGWETVAPSALAFNETDRVPIALDKKGIQGVVQAFKQAAVRADKAGFKIVEIHAAHGYLLNEFLSPLSNKRTDEYGGSFENRIRLLLEVVTAVREVWPASAPLFVRVSATEWLENGWTINDTITLGEQLKQYGVNLMDCSSGGNMPHVKIPLHPGYQVPLAEAVKKETGILTGAVGLITDAVQADNIIKEGKADIILLGREFLRNPYLPMHWANTLNQTIQWPVQYERARLKK